MRLGGRRFVELRGAHVVAGARGGPVETVVAIVAAVTDALDHAHRSTLARIHRRSVLAPLPADCP